MRSRSSRAKVVGFDTNHQSARIRTMVGLVALSALLSATFASRAAAVAAPPDFYGLTTVGQLYNDYEAEHAESLGVHNVRVNFAWNSVQSASCDGETANSGLDFSYNDRIVRNAANHNVTVIANLYRSRASCNNTRFPNPGTTMYGAWKLQNSNGYVWSLVQRYGFSGTFWQENPGLPYHPIRIWEVWNEENLPVNNPGGTIQPQKYAQFLVDTAATIRSAQEQQSGQPVSTTDTKVLMGGLAPFAEGTYVTNYLNSIYSSPSGYTASQFHNAFDGFSYHPYALTGNSAAAMQEVNNARGALDQRRSALSGGSDANKTLWITEAGWPVMSLSSTPNDYLQAQALSEFFPWMYINADAKKIKYAAWYVNQDWADSCGSWSCWDQVSGLRRSNGSERPSWCTYADIIQVNFCNPWPVAWSNDNLGGYKTSDPSISSRGSGQLDVFARGGDNALWHKWFSPSTGWSSWYTLYGSLTSGPDSVSWGSDRVDVVARAGDGSVFHKYWNGSSWYENNLGGGILGSPTISSMESERLDVFARGGDSALWHRWFTPSTGWSSWYTLYGSLTSGPDAVSWGPNRVDVVARASDGSVFHKYWNGTGWYSDSLGGCITGDPAISSRDWGQLDVFARGCNDNSLMHKWFSPSTGWSPWETLYGLLDSSPDATSWGPNRIDIVARGHMGNNSILHAWWGS